MPVGPGSYSGPGALQAVLQLAASGGGAIVGNATLVAGTRTVLTTAANASAVILISRKTTIGTNGALSVGAIVPGVSFVINSANAGDLSVVSWLIVN